MAKFEEEKANWEKNKNNNRSSTAVLDMELEEARGKAMQQLDRDILELLPKVHRPHHRPQRPIRQTRAG
jgi:hypothetical protein